MEYWLYLVAAIFQLVPIFCELYLHTRPKDTDEEKEAEKPKVIKQWTSSSSSGTG
jgi:hypothetical protein